uniref:SPE1 n=1 Tax=Arundo donax TaxID=35708 RepID=A0A0A9BUV8_ARUDO
MGGVSGDKSESDQQKRMEWGGDEIEGKKEESKKRIEIEIEIDRACYCGCQKRKFWKGR